MDQLETRIKNYLQTKYSQKTVGYVCSILNALNVKDPIGTPIQIRSKDLERQIVPEYCEHTGNFFRFLNEMVELKIINKISVERQDKDRGRPGVAYQLPNPINIDFVLDALYQTDTTESFISIVKCENKRGIIEVPECFIGQTVRVRLTVVE